MRHKQDEQGPDSLKIWTWRPGIAATFDLPGPLPVRVRRVPRTRSAMMRAEHRAFEYALDRWLDEGGRDVYSNDDVVAGVSVC